MAIQDPIPETQRAAQYHSDENKVHINTIPVPVPEEFELLVKTSCSSLCRSDLMNFEPNDIGLKLHNSGPVTMGHEAAGVVVSVGKDTKGFKIGDEVGFLPSTNVCFDCEGCQVHQMWCDTYGGCKMPGHAANGFFQEYIAVHWRNAIKLPEGMSAVEAAPVFCAGVTGYHGVDDCGLKPGDWMAIIGCGGLGHFGIQYAKAMGFRVIGLDISDEQLKEAKACGAEHVFNTMTDPNYVEKIKKITDGGCHAVVNYTNSKPSYDNAPKVLRINGILMVVGLPQAPLSFSALDIALRKYRIMGSSNKVPAVLKDCVEFTAKHGIKSQIEYFKLDEIQHMIDLLTAGKVRGRVAVKF